MQATILTSFHSFFHHFAPKAIAKAVTPHDILDVIPRCSNDILKSFTNHFFLTRYSILVTPVPKNSFLNNNNC